MDGRDPQRGRGAGDGAPAGFFALDAADRWTLAALAAYAAFSFLPWWRSIEVAGMALFGWLMAGLMVLSPILALARLWVGRRRGPRPDAEGHR